MKAHRIWIEIVVLGAAIALAVALLIASLGAVAGAAEQLSIEDHTYEGMVTCSRCGARHSTALGQNASVCVRICVHGGANFALVSPESTYILDGDRNNFKKLAGQRARVVGSLNGNTIKVESIVGQGQAMME